MRTLEEIKQQTGIMVQGRIKTGVLGDYEVYHGIVEWPGFKGSVIFGFNEGRGMEHVSVSHNNKHRLPTWSDMCKLKDIFFRPEEMAVQVHPQASRYVHSAGDRDNILHLWRPVNGDWSILNNPEAWD